MSLLIVFSSGLVSFSGRLSLVVSGGRLESQVTKTDLSEFSPGHGAVPSFSCIRSSLARITDSMECHFIFDMPCDLPKLEIEFKI